jgi:hypothetical protein
MTDRLQRELTEARKMYLKDTINDGIVFAEDNAFCMSHEIAWHNRVRVYDVFCHIIGKPTDCIRGMTDDAAYKQSQRSLHPYDEHARCEQTETETRYCGIYRVKQEWGDKIRWFLVEHETGGELCFGSRRPTDTDVVRFMASLGVTV